MCPMPFTLATALKLRSRLPYQLAERAGARVAFGVRTKHRRAPASPTQSSKATCPNCVANVLDYSKLWRLS